MIGRSGRFQAIALGYNAIVRETAQPRDKLGIGLSFEAGLYRFPVIRAEEIGKSCREDRLPDLGVRAGHHNPPTHRASPRVSSIRASSIARTSSFPTLSVREIRNRAVPAGT